MQIDHELEPKSNRIPTLVSIRLRADTYDTYYVL